MDQWLENEDEFNMEDIIARHQAMEEELEQEELKEDTAELPEYPKEQWKKWEAVVEAVLFTM